MTGSEVITMHVTAQAKRKPGPSKAQHEEPETWQQAMRSSLGKTTLPVPSQQPPVNRKHPGQEEAEEHETWAQRLHLSREEDDRMQESSDSDRDDVSQGMHMADSQAVNIQEDEYIEDSKPVLPLKRAKGQKAHKQRDLKVQHLESGMLKLQSQLDALLKQLQPVFSAPALVRAVQASKAQIPWPSEFHITEQQQRKVPGHGDCLWHSLLACSLSHEALLAEVAAGKQFKAAMVQKIQQGGCQSAGVLAAVGEWATEWADGRALVSAAYESQATILVLNRKDKVLEVVTTHSEPWQQALWTLEYSGDHYTPVQRLAPDTLAALCPLFSFQPWIARPGDMKGGSVSRTMWHDQLRMMRASEIAPS